MVSCVSSKHINSGDARTASLFLNSIKIKAVRGYNNIRNGILHFLAEEWKKIAPFFWFRRNDYLRLG